MPASPTTALYFDRRTYPDGLLHLYYELLKPCLMEEKMLILLRQGKVSKWFSGIGDGSAVVACQLCKFVRGNRGSPCLGCTS